MTRFRKDPSTHITVQSFHPALSCHPCLIQISETKYLGWSCSFHHLPKRPTMDKCQATQLILGKRKLRDETTLNYILYSTFDFSPISRQKKYSAAPRTFYCLEIGAKSKVLYNIYSKMDLFSITKEVHPKYRKVGNLIGGAANSKF